MDANTTELTTGLYDYSVLISSAAGTTSYNKQIYIQTSSGPYLAVSIGTFSSTVTSGQEDVNFSATVTNLGTQEATGVWLNWTLPSEFELDAGDLNRNLSNIPIGGNGTNTITISVSDSAADSTVSISAASSSTENSSDSDSKQITIGTPVQGGAGGTGGGQRSCRGCKGGRIFKNSGDSSRRRGFILHRNNK